MEEERQKKDAVDEESTKPFCEEAPGIILPLLGPDQLGGGQGNSSDSKLRTASKDHLKSTILMDLNVIIFPVKRNLHHKHNFAKRRYKYQNMYSYVLI